MPKLLVVKGDPVSGTDQHNVKGDFTNPSPPPATLPSVWVGDYGYAGSITDGLSDFVTVNGTPLALTSSQSSLDPGEAASGKHFGANGGNFQPTAPAPIPATLSITDSPLGGGTPNAGAGSGLLTVNGVRALLAGDAIDTCSGIGVPADSAVAAQGQDFVSCSE